MPVPTPPKVKPEDLVKLPVLKKKTDKRILVSTARPSKSTQKLQADIQNLTETLDENSTDIPHIVYEKDEEGKTLVKPPVKKTPFKPAEHLTQSPFRDNEEMRNLQRELKKEINPKTPIKRAPRRKPAVHNKAGEN